MSFEFVGVMDLDDIVIDFAEHPTEVWCELRERVRPMERRRQLRMKRPRGGSLFLLLTPDELLAKLATLVPPPRVHGQRYHGVFAPNSKVRARVREAQRVRRSRTHPDGGARVR